ncbi:hypothetical protein M9Y10_016507 [Tritrichomonas musculus]|uniref:NADPH--hemoprotein reductase n=1 Tax=Tritrichomonas musculus TaxID=1915356 RepID=A0ABR2HWD4_9EUKA
MTVLEACRSANIYIPTLCFHDDLPASGKCGLCSVKINGNAFTYACIHKLTNNMTIETNTPEVIAKVRRTYNNFIDMAIPPHSKDIEDILTYLYPKNTVRSRDSDKSHSLSFNSSLCINCGRCTRMCTDVQNIGALNYLNPRIKDNECISCGQCITVCPTDALSSNSSKPSILKAISRHKIMVLQIAPAARVAIGEGFGNAPGSVCTGKIIQAAREIGFKYIFDTNFGADVTVIEEGNELLRRLKVDVNPSFAPSAVDNTIHQTSTKGIVASTSDMNLVNAVNSPLAKPIIEKPQISKPTNPLYRRRSVSIHAIPICSPTLKKPNTFSLENSPSSTVSNNNNSDSQPEPQAFMPKHKIDMTRSAMTLKQYKEQEAGPLPQFTSCCPAWVNYVEKLHHEIIPHLSTTKSPHMIVGKLVKTYFAKMINADPNDIFLVSLMPCVAKKDEIKRMQLNGDVDAVMTSKEFIDLFAEYGLDFNSLGESKFDSLLGECTGAGQIFGTTGGVAEASVRYIHKLVTQEPLNERIEYESLRGMNSIKTATVEVGNYRIKIAVCNGIAAAGELIESEKYKNFHFVEVMACPGGCVGGAGQPYLPKKQISERISSIFDLDRSKKVRVSDGNREVAEIYSNFLGEPGGLLAHELLHTHYEPQETAMLAQRRRMMSMPIVGYGSSSGTAMKLSRIVAGFIETSSVAMNRLSVKELLTRKIAIFIVSTIGEGEFPNNARKFIDKLRDSEQTLSGVRYAVCGLGNESYTYFCQAGIDLDTMLEQHRAERILPLIKIDTSTDDKGEAIFEGWCHQLCAAMGLKPPKIGIHLSFSLVPVEDQTVASNPLRPVGFEIATLKGNELLTPEQLNDTNCQMNFYQIKLPKGVSYSTGDLLEILPENPPELVDKVIEAMKLNAEQVYTLVSNDSSVETFVPEKVTVRQLLTQYLDLNGMERLTKILEVDQPEEVKEYLRDVNTCEFICEFSKYGVPSIDLLMSSCPHTKPRSYFISSSPMRNQNMVSLVVTKRRFGKDNKRRGVCTTYLEQEDLKKVPIRITQSSFELPESRHAPIVMVAIGCGIAPMLSMIQNKGSQNGPILLIFGSTSAKVHGKLIDEIGKERENGTISDVLYAWSDEGIMDRDVKELGSVYDIEKNTEEKILEVMTNNKSVIWNYWSDVTAAFYYCGIPGPLPDKLKELLLKITIEEGFLSIEEAMATNNRHQVFIEVF